MHKPQTITVGSAERARRKRPAYIKWPLVLVGAGHHRRAGDRVPS